MPPIEKPAHMSEEEFEKRKTRGDFLEEEEEERRRAEAEAEEAEAEEEDTDEEEATTDDEEEDNDDGPEKPADEATDEEDSEEAEEVEASGEEDPDETEAEAEARKRGIMIPKFRYDAKLDEANRYKKRVQELEQQLASSKKETGVEGKDDAESELVKVQQEIDDALSSGDIDKVRELRSRERALDRQMVQEEAIAQAQQVIEEREFNSAVAEVEETYPEFDKNSDKYDAELTQEAIKWTRRITADGVPPAAALKEAIDLVYSRYERETAEAEKTEVRTPKNKAKAEETRKNRKQAAVKKAAETAKKQPPSLRDRGSDSDSAGVREAIDPNKLTIEEWEALPASKKKALRGDLS